MSLAGQGGMECIFISGLLQAIMGRGCFGGLDKVIGRRLWGGQFFGGVVNCWPGVHAGGGAGRWALGYYLWGFRTSLIFANFLSPKLFRS